MAGTRATIKKIAPDAVWNTAARGKRALRALSPRFRTQYIGGASVECPFCEGRFRRFLPIGILDREFFRSDEGRAVVELDHVTVCNMQCPRCGSSERHRLAYFYLKQALKIDSMSGIRLLDVAPDEFMTTAVFDRADIDYVSIDLVRANASFNMDITDLKFDDDSFDAIICYHTLEHVKRDSKAMSELHRVLKPGGWAIIQVPLWAAQTFEDDSISRSDYLKYYGHVDHVRRYGLDFKDRLTSAGFKVTLDSYVRRLPEEFVRHYGLLPNEDIYYCEKKSS